MSGNGIQGFATLDDYGRARSFLAQHAQHNALRARVAGMEPILAEVDQVSLAPNPATPGTLLAVIPKSLAACLSQAPGPLNPVTLGLLRAIAELDGKGR